MTTQVSWISGIVLILIGFTWTLNSWIKQAIPVKRDQRHKK